MVSPAEPCTLSPHPRLYNLRKLTISQRHICPPRPGSPHSWVHSQQSGADIQQRHSKGVPAAPDVKLPPRPPAAGRTQLVCAQDRRSAPQRARKHPKPSARCTSPGIPAGGAAMAGALPGFLVPGCTLIICPAGHLQPGQASVSI